MPSVGPLKPVLLIVEDDPDMRLLLRTVLKQAGVTSLVEAPDVATATTLLQRHRVHAIFCDWHMPGTSGLEFLQSVRATRETRNVPFYMITSEDNREQVLAAVKHGVTDYIVKPFSLHTIATKLRPLLGAGFSG